MTPQFPKFASQSDVANIISQTHLTEDQFGDMLTDSADSTSGPAQAHLLSCEQCAAELVTLRESISLFRHAASTYADAELRRLPQMSLPSRRLFSPALEPAWLVAAVAVFLIAFLPMQLSRQHAGRSRSTIAATVADNASASESDDALLEDVDRETATSVPAPMQALADPTASISATPTDTLQSSSQRKD